MKWSWVRFDSFPENLAIAINEVKNQPAVCEDSWFSLNLS